MPSWFEGLPVTAVEAQAAGLPCVLSSAITSECGVVDSTVFVPLMGNEELWLAAILKCVDKVIDRSAVADVVRESGFGVEAVAEQIENVYMGLKN